MEKLWWKAYPIFFKHLNSWAIRLGWLVGIKYFSAKSRLFGRCSWPLNDVRKTVLNVPSPIRRWILKMLSTSGIWDFNSATSSAIAWWKRNIALNEWKIYRVSAHAEKHIVTTCSIEFTLHWAEAYFLCSSIEIMHVLLHSNEFAFK